MSLLPFCLFLNRAQRRPTVNQPLTCFESQVLRPLIHCYDEFAGPTDLGKVLAGARNVRISRLGFCMCNSHCLLVFCSIGSCCAWASPKFNFEFWKGTMPHATVPVTILTTNYLTILATDQSLECIGIWLKASWALNHRLALRLRLHLFRRKGNSRAPFPKTTTIVNDIFTDEWGDIQKKQ